MRTILVTGATGTIGRAVIRILSQHGDVAIRAATRDPAQLRADSGAGARQLTPVAFDWDAPDAASEITAAAGTMLVLPPAARHSLPATARLLDSAIANGVQHVVFLSTLGADFQPGFAFGRWALTGEQAVAAAGLPYTVLRPNSYMSNFLTMQRPGLDGAIRLPWGDGACSFVDPGDVAAVAAQVLLEPHGHDGRTYELTGPEALGLHAVAAILGTATGISVHYVDTPLATVRDVLSSRGLPQPMVTAFAELHSVMATSARAPVTSHVQQVTGRPPRSFAGFAAEHAAALNKVNCTPWSECMTRVADPARHRHVPGTETGPAPRRPARPGQHLQSRPRRPDQPLGRGRGRAGADGRGRRHAAAAHRRLLRLRAVRLLHRLPAYTRTPEHH